MYMFAQITGNQVDWSQTDWLDTVNLDLEDALKDGEVDAERFYNDDEYREEIWMIYSEMNANVMYKPSRREPFYRMIHDTNNNSIVLWGRVPLDLLTREGIEDLLEWNNEPYRKYSIVEQNEEAYMIIR